VLCEFQLISGHEIPEGTTNHLINNSLLPAHRVGRNLTLLKLKFRSVRWPFQPDPIAHSASEMTSERTTACLAHSMTASDPAEFVAEYISATDKCQRVTASGVNKPVKEPMALARRRRLGLGRSLIDHRLAFRLTYSFQKIVEPGVILIPNCPSRIF
jgi:hypothetical protein